MGDLIIEAFSNVWTIQTLILISLGIPIGLIIGAIPGLGGTIALAVFIPFTFKMPVLQAIIFLQAIYRSTTYGGSVSAILLRIPGTPEAAATLLDGYPLTEQGKAGKALGLMLYASTLGELVSDLTLMFVAVHIAKMAMKFGPAEYFALLVFSLSIIGTLAGGSVLKGLLSALIGLLLATVGMDPIIGTPRFDIGIFELTKGLDFIALLVGLFGMSEVFIQADKGMKKFLTSTKTIVESPRPEDRRCTWPELRSQAVNILRSGMIGTFVGALPALGGAVSCWIGRGVAQRFSKHPEKFGTGSLEGLAAPEAANSAVHGGCLIPLLTLGIPGNAPAAVIGAAFMMKGIVPGPLMFQQNTLVIYSLYAALFTINVFIFFHAVSYFNKAARYFVSFSPALIYSMVTIFCILGTYLVNNSMFDVGFMLLMGIVGYFMNKTGIPIPPLIMAFLLGEMTENNFRLALKISETGLSIFFASPLSILFFILTLVLMGTLIWGGWKGKVSPLGIR